MVASLVTPADVVNVALSRIGYKLSIGSLYDGSEAAGRFRSTRTHATSFCARMIGTSLSAICR